VLISSRIFITTLVGMLEYILAMSSDANFVLLLMGVLSKSSVRCIEFLTLKAYGSGMCTSMSLESNWASLCAGAFCQLTIGLIGVPFL